MQEIRCKITNYFYVNYIYWFYGGGPARRFKAVLSDFSAAGDRATRLAAGTVTASAHRKSM